MYKNTLLIIFSLFIAQTLSNRTRNAMKQKLKAKVVE